VRRGEVYLVSHPSSSDPRRQRAFVVVSRQLLIDSRFSTVVCAPVYSSNDGLCTQVPVGPEEGLKHASSVHCDELVSLPKARLANYLGALSAGKLALLEGALKEALDIED